MSDGTEANSRSMIDQQLRQQGWEPGDPNQIRQEYVLDDVTRADYVLRDRLGRPLAVIEAKRTRIDPVDGERQALHYAEMLDVKLIFLANGRDIWFWRRDLQAHPHKVRTFFTQADMERIAATFTVTRNPLTVPVDTKIAGSGESRYYQLECIDAVSLAILQGKRKVLVEMATGTGKTRTAAAIIKRLFQSGHVTRVLFLVDRDPLATQTEKEFVKLLPEYASYVLKRGRFRDEKNITITTLQSMINVYKEYSAGYFDLIVIDECHRSIYGEWKSIVTYYDSIKIGLTATPCIVKQSTSDPAEDEENKLVRDTLRFFECDRPTYSYGITKAIRDGNLVTYHIFKAKTNLMLIEDGIEIDRSMVDNENDPVVIAELFKDKEKITVDPQQLERKFTIPARNRAIVREFREVLYNGFTDNKGFHKPHDGKTIVFAVTKKHAQTLAQMLDDEFADKKIDNAGNVDSTIRYADYVVSGDEERPGKKMRDIIEAFEKETYPKIIVSVGMLDTGFDCPEVVNIVMARFVRSSILYQQMRGRGLRTAEHIGKEFCTIFDFAGVTDYFHDEGNDSSGYYVVVKPKPKPGGGRKTGLLVLDMYDDIAAETREWIEVGENGERVDIRTYLDESKDAIHELKDTLEVQQVLQYGDFQSAEDEARFEERVKQARVPVSLRDVRTALNKPFMKWKHLIRYTLLGEEVNTADEELNEAFETWMASQEEPFTDEQIRILTMLKNQFVRNRKLIQEFDMTRFNRPPFQQIGGLYRVKQLFGERMEQLLQELKELFQGDDSGNGAAS